jgi:hypothetical protein
MPGEPSFLTRSGGDPVAAFEALINRFTHPSHDALQKAGLLITQAIRAKALSGVSYTGAAFAPYSASYAKEKGQTNVDLFSHYSRPHMLDVLESRITNNPPMIEVGIFGNAEIAWRAQVNNEGGTFRTRAGKSKSRYQSKKSRATAISAGKRATGTVPARPWLGIDDRTLDAAQAVIVNSLTE